MKRQILIDEAVAAKAMVMLDIAYSLLEHTRSIHTQDILQAFKELRTEIERANNIAQEGCQPPKLKELETRLCTQQELQLALIELIKDHNSFVEYV